MDCNECKSNKKAVESIPYVAYEGVLARFEKQLKRLWIALIIAVCACVAITGGFLWYLNQYDFTSSTSTSTTIEAQQDGEGVNIVGAGDVDYGAESKDNG